MKEENIKKLIQSKEYEKLDFKKKWYQESKYNSEEIVKDIIGLANGGPSHIGKTAFLIIGVKEKDNVDNEIFDVSIDKPISQLKREIIQNINNYAKPSITNIDVFNLKYLEKNILVIEIKQHPYLIVLKKDLRLPEYREGDIIFRIGESTKRASLEVGNILIKEIEMLEQKKEVEKNSFDIQFFSHLSLFNKILPSIEIIKSGRSIKKLDVFKELKEEIINKLSQSIGEYPENDDIYSREIIYFQYKYKELYKDYSDALGVYFRNLYNIVIFVHEETPENISKGKYFQIILDQLSNSELIILFFNSVSFFIYEKKHKILEKYNFFKKIKYEDVIGKNHPERKEYTEVILALLFICYHPTAFGDNYEQLEEDAELSRFADVRGFIKQKLTSNFT